MLHRFVISLLALLLFTLPAYSGPFARRQATFSRVKQALQKRGPIVSEQFSKAGAAFPVRGIFLRAFKDEGVLELWAAPKKGKRWVRVRTFPVCAASGVLGPKRAEGDYQVPEGAYFINRFNPRSSFHLSLGLNYPNAVDKHRSRGLNPGSDIFIHGDCVTVGCLPLKDGPMEDLYLAAMWARDRGQKRIPVHTFPCRFGTPSCMSRLSKVKSSETHAFWADLRRVYQAFEKDRVPPRVHAGSDGAYRVRTTR
jgi:murein L,D-transpeptidase YafK